VDEVRVHKPVNEDYSYAGVIIDLFCGTGGIVTGTGNGQKMVLRLMQRQAIVA
jgi:hypothetical protein